MSRRTRVHPVLIAALMLMAVAAARASTVVPMDLTELTRRADRVFLGICVAAVPAPHEAGAVTQLSFAVTESLKSPAGAPAPDTLAITLPGGVWQDVRFAIAGMPEFAVGDEVVLFLTGADSGGRVWPVGLGQGSFRVERPAVGPPVARPVTAGLHYAGVARPAGPPAPMQLQTLMRRVRALTDVPEAR